MQENNTILSTSMEAHHDSKHHHHHHKKRYDPRVDRKCSPRRQRKLLGKIIFAILSLVAIAVMAMAIYITIYGV